MSPPSVVNESPTTVSLPPRTEEEDEDEKICRYCFEDEEDGELISPCACKGGQRYVHLACLRRWQRMVLVSQSTHPAFYTDDARHHECNVCKTAFTCEPPTRHELMESFTGYEIASLIDTSCIIGSHAVFDTELEQQMERLGPFHRRLTSYDHWIRGVYLITAIDRDGTDIELPLREMSTLQAIRHILLTSNNSEATGSNDMIFEMQGERLRLVRGGSLHTDNLRQELLSLTRVPASLTFKSDAPPSIGNDHVVAINLARRAPHNTPNTAVVEAATMAACERFPGVRSIKIDHFLGGPCDEDEIVCCLVAGGSGRGWTVVNKSFINRINDRSSSRQSTQGYEGESLLTRALILAHSRSTKRHPNQGDSLCGGVAVRLVGLQARPELNNQLGILLTFNVDAGRWLVRLGDGSGKQVKPINLECVDAQVSEANLMEIDEVTQNTPHNENAAAEEEVVSSRSASLTSGGGGGQVLAFWGDARWTRSQLLGEIARGHWGLCKASVTDVLINPPESKHAALDGRLVFAPVTEMTEDFLRMSQLRMDAIHQNRLARGSFSGDDEEKEEEKDNGDY